MLLYAESPFLACRNDFVPGICMYLVDFNLERSALQLNNSVQ